MRFEKLKSSVSKLIILTPELWWCGECKYDGIKKRICHLVDAQKSNFTHDVDAITSTLKLSFLRGVAPDEFIKITVLTDGRLVVIACNDYDTKTL